MKVSSIKYCICTKPLFMKVLKFSLAFSNKEGANHISMSSYYQINSNLHPNGLVWLVYGLQATAIDVYFLYKMMKCQRLSN